MASCANERMKWRDTNCSSHQPDDAGATRHPPSARNWNRPSTSRQTCKRCKVPQGTFSLLKAATATNGHLKKLSPLILGPLSEKPSMTGALVSQDFYDPPSLPVMNFLTSIPISFIKVPSSNIVQHCQTSLARLLCCGRGWAGRFWHWPKWFLVIPR